MRGTVFLDSFSGALADLPPKKRNLTNALIVLSKHPNVSTWDMDKLWLRKLISDLITIGLIQSEPVGYPWLKYSLTESGLKEIEE